MFRKFLSRHIGGLKKRTALRGFGQALATYDGAWSDSARIVGIAEVGGTPAMKDLMLIFSRIESGDPAASEHLLRLVHDEMRRLAEQRFTQEKLGHPLQPTALLNEAYVWLVVGGTAQHWNNRGHFLEPRPRPCGGFS